MNFLDIRTILFSHVITDIVSTIVMILLWYQNRNRFKGTLFWVANFLLNTLGVILIILRGNIPDFLSIIVSNGIIVIGFFMGYIGLQRFLEKKKSLIFNYFLILLFFIIQIHFTYNNPYLPLRTLNLFSTLLIIFFQCTWLMLYNVDRAMRSITAGAGTIFSLICLITIVHIILIFFGNYSKTDYFQSGTSATMVLLSSQILFLLLAYTLTLMFNKRLLLEIKTQEEKYSKAFHSSSYAITLIRISDGRIIEANEGFCKQTGFRSDEVIGRTTLDLDLWVDDKNRALGILEVESAGRIHDREYQFKNKSGEIRTGLVYADIITVNNEKCILATIDDITDRKHAENRIKDLLKEKELILKEVHHRVKNNMNIVFSLLTLEAENHAQSETKNILLDSAGRVQSMMVLYDRLYRSDIKEKISARDYFSALVNEIASIFSHKTNVKFTTEIDDFTLEPDLLSPLGIIINEFITNSMKYAFREQTEGNINIKILNNISSIKIIFEDDGNGIPETVNFESSSGFGLQLVSMLVKQLKGSIKIESGKGTRFIIEIHK